MNGITVINEKDEEIGEIKWFVPEYNDNGIKQIKILWVGVSREYQGKGLASLLIFKMLSSIKYRGKLEITLDDCSEKSLSKDCLYYKLGFRHASEFSGPDMSVFIKYDPGEPGYTYYGDTTPEPVNIFKSVTAFKNTITLKAMEPFKFKNVL